MKRLILLGSTAALLALTACSGTDATTSVTGSPAPPAQPTQAQPGSETALGFAVGDCWTESAVTPVPCTSTHTALTIATYPSTDLPMSYPQTQLLVADLNAFTDESQRPKADLALVEDFNEKMGALIQKCTQTRRDVLGLALPDGGYRSTLFFNVVQTPSQAEWEAGDHSARCDLSLGKPVGDALVPLPQDLKTAARQLHNQTCRAIDKDLYCDKPKAYSWLTVITDRPMPNLGSTPSSRKEATERLNRYCRAATTDFIARGTTLTTDDINSHWQNAAAPKKSSTLQSWDDPATTISCDIPNWASNLA